MNQALASDNSDFHSDLSDVTAFGRRIFLQLGKEQPSSFDKNYWSGRIMEWSMTKPEFKLNMFRLIDVLPSLRSSESVARHVNEYLGSVGKSIHGLLDWGLNANPKSIRGRLTSVVVRKSVQQMAAQFIAGRDAASALRPLRRLRRNQLAFTVDLLGEFSVSEAEAEAYLNRYLEALTVIGREAPRWPEGAPIIAGHPGDSSPVCVSVKLSALYSQCSPLNMERSVTVLSERLSQIVRAAREVKASVYVDAEDTGNNSIIYETFMRVFGSPEFKDIPYPGIVLQAYTKDAKERLSSLIDFARRRGAPIAIRLVKGAYWDHETIVCKQQGWESPLFAKKESTDANYELLTRMMLDHPEEILSAFGSHNIRSLSHACCYAAEKGVGPDRFELQMLYGMAEPIARAFQKEGYLVRLYVPLGEMLPGMGYLVRRLLENTSNESFLRHTFYDAENVDQLLRVPRFVDDVAPQS